jgi:lysophospholipase L1-like esterase
MFRSFWPAACAAIACSCGVPAQVPASAPRAEPRLVGRFDKSQPEGPRYAWSHATIEARFEGRAIAVRLRIAPLAPSLTRAHETSTPYTVIVDGESPRTIEVTSTIERYELARDLAPGVHTVTLVREAEAFAGVHQLLGFEVEGGQLLPPAAPRARSIEVIGDSITCGYGVLGADAKCPFSFTTERASSSYASVAARALDADLSVVCWSGRGVIRNYDGSSAGVAPELFEQALPEPHVAFDFEESPQPDAVVVLLGTNDFLGGAGAPLDIASFERTYERFLTRVRELRPRAFVVVATSPMLEPGPVRELAHASIAHVVAARKRVDPRIELLDFEWQRDRTGCDYHPNAAMHRLLGGALAALLRKQLPAP